jgi:hypothetical protein
MNFSTLPSDLYGLIYSYLKWHEKVIFISLTREIYSNSRPYREFKFTRKQSRRYATESLFREHISHLALESHLKLRLGYLRLEKSSLICNQTTDESVMHLGHVHTLDLSRWNQITDQSVMNFGGLHTLILRYSSITDRSLACLSQLHTIILSHCRHITDAGLVHLRHVQVQS